MRTHQSVCTNYEKAFKDEQESEIHIAGLLNKCLLPPFTPGEKLCPFLLSCFDVS